MNDPFAFNPAPADQKLGEIKDPFASYMENKKQEEESKKSEEVKAEAGQETVP